MDIISNSESRVKLFTNKNKYSIKINQIEAFTNSIEDKYNLPLFSINKLDIKDNFLLKNINELYSINKTTVNVEDVNRMNDYQKTRLRKNMYIEFLEQKLLSCSYKLYNMKKITYMMISEFDQIYNNLYLKFKNDINNLINIINSNYYNTQELQKNIKSFIDLNNGTQKKEIISKNFNTIEALIRPTYLSNILTHIQQDTSSINSKVKSIYSNKINAYITKNFHIINEIKIINSKINNNIDLLKALDYELIQNVNINIFKNMLPLS